MKNIREKEIIKNSNSKGRILKNQQTLLYSWNRQNSSKIKEENEKKQNKKRKKRKNNWKKQLDCYEDYVG